MNWIGIKSLLNSALSNYSSKRTNLMRKGRYSSGDYYSDGYVSMLYETLIEIKEDEDLYPLTNDQVRKLIYTFNRLTGEKVPDVWED